MKPLFLVAAFKLVVCTNQMKSKQRGPGHLTERPEDKQDRHSQAEGVESFGGHGSLP